MASLKEIKGRIASVGSTLKITSAMKMVASAKLHKAQSAIGNMVPYQKRLLGMLEDLLSAEALPDDSAASHAGQADPSADWSDGHSAVRSDGASAGWSVYLNGRQHPRSVALVCFSSNSSLCGGFNANAIREALKVVNEYKAAGVEVTVYSVGRKMAEAMRKAGYPSPEDFTDLSAKPSYEAAAELSDRLVADFREGRTDHVDLIYNHFVSTAVHRSVCETYLPMEAVVPAEGEPSDDEFIIEPDKEELLGVLLPKLLKLKVYTVLLDASAAEHAARTVAMQTASDNAEDLLQELSLEYNKSRQAKITAEILDLAGGAQD
jgi:F-type H+-transporting ATPase subunit gamma